MSWNKRSNGVYDADTGLRVSKDGPLEWRKAGQHQAASHTWKWELFVPTLVPNHVDDGLTPDPEWIQIGGLRTNIEVYESGAVSWPGREVAKFSTKEEAMRFVEVTYALEE